MLEIFFPPLEPVLVGSIVLELTLPLMSLSGETMFICNLKLKITIQSGV